VGAVLAVLSHGLGGALLLALLPVLLLVQFVCEMCWVQMLVAV
jgi:hypothetical protein